MMPNLHNVLPDYSLSVLALALAAVYFCLVRALLHFFYSPTTLVTRYDPPEHASPGVAAWLFDQGELPRAIAAALVNMAAKGYVQIEQDGETYSLTRLGPDASLELEPEEDALARTLFRDYDSFDFDDSSPQWEAALEAFNCALMDTTYFSRHVLLSVPAWILSGFGIGYALIQSNFLRHADRLTITLLAVAFGCLIVAVRTLPGTLQKIASRLPGSTAPKRPWSGEDTMNSTLLVISFGGFALLTWFSTTATALLVAGFLAIDAIFFHVLQGPTAEGIAIITQLSEYRKFLSEVDADLISRINSCESVPAELTQKHAYAIAFRLDLGWGEQFVDAITSLVERVEVFGKVLQPQDS